MAEPSTDLLHRSTDLAKGEWGRLIILAGSSQLAGAAVLNTQGALRTGIDTVVVAAPERAANAVLYAAPTAIALAIPRRTFEPGHLRFIKQFRGYPVAMGSGLTVGKPVEKFVRGVLKTFDGPFVLDADALRMVAGVRNPAKLWSGKRVVLTPNRVEYALLTGKKDPDLLTTIQPLARLLGATVVCKGPTDFISDGQAVVEISGGSEFLAGSGSGDVLTGVIGALLARGLPSLDAAVTGCRLLKNAGERAEADKGPSLVAHDLPDYLDARKLPKDSNKEPGPEPPPASPPEPADYQPPISASVEGNSSADNG